MATPAHTQHDTEASLLDAAAKLGPMLAAARADGDRSRSLPHDVVEAMKRAGVFRACQPARARGLGLPFGAQTRVGAQLAESWGSAGWLASVMGTHHWILGKFPYAAQDRVWAEDPEAIVASAFASVDAHTQRVDGGFQIRGRWLFASGIEFASWCIVLAPPVGEDDLPRFMVIAQDDFEILDTWRAVGMRGTGSHDLRVESAFVPEHSTLRVDEIEAIQTPGVTQASDSHYQLPFSGVVSFCVAAPALGLARGALAAFRADMSARTGIIAGKLAANTSLQIRASEASAEIDCAQLLYDAAIERMAQKARSGASWTPLEVAELKRDASYLGLLCRRAVDRLAEAMGAKGLAEESPVQMAKQDVQAACAHISMVWDANAQPYGRGLLGLDPQ